MKCDNCIHAKVCIWHKELEDECNEDCADFMPHQQIADCKTNIFDEVETVENCTVEIWRNSVTGECSVGWRRNGE